MRAVAARHDHCSMPAIHRQTHQMRKLLLGARGDGEIDAVAGHHLGDLLGCALMQMQAHLRVLGAKLRMTGGST